MRTNVLVAALINTVLGGTSITLAGDSLSYRLKPDPATGCIDIELSWLTEGRTTSVIGFVQRFGTVSDVPALAKDVKFTGVTNILGRSGPNWTLEHRNGATIRVTYRIESGKTEFDWDCTHHPIATESFFHGIGSNFLMTPTDSRTPFEVSLRWDIPKDWKAACSWGVGKHLGASMTLAALRQSAYLAGDLDIRPSAKGAAHDVSFAAAKAGGLDVDGLAKMATEIVAAECAFVREENFPEYVVTAIPVGKTKAGEGATLAGTGLENGLALWLAPGAGPSDAVQHLFAHELFHFWNGRILKPADDDRLMLWFVEGLTDYYALRILRESGIWDTRTYSTWINKHLRAYFFNPARNATNEQIRSRFWEHRETFGEAPYQRGLALGLRWHAMARSKGIADGVDRLLRTMLDTARGPTAAGDSVKRLEISNRKLREDAVRVLGTWFASEFDQYVIGAATIDIPTDALLPELPAEIVEVHEYELGFDRAKSVNEKRICGLIAGSAAYSAGLRDGDELIRGNLSGDSDREISLEIRRDGETRTIRYLPRGAKAEIVQFRPR